MADPKDFQFAIVGVDQSAPAWDAATRQSVKHNAALQKGAEGTRSRLQKVLGPARELAPSLDHGLKQLEKLHKVSKLVGQAFKPSGAAYRSPVQAASEIARARTSGGAAKLAATIARNGGGDMTATTDFGGRPRSGGGMNLPSFRTGGAVGEAEATAGRAALAEGAAEAGVAEAGAGAAAVGEAAGAAGLALGGLATGIGALVVAAVAGRAILTIAEAKFASTYARSAQEIGRTADLIGVDSDKLQRWRGASERAGLDPKAADGAIADVGMTLHNLSYGQGDPVQANLLRRLGVAIPKPGEKVDPDAVLKQIADKLQGIQDPYTRQNIASRLGVTSLLPMLSKGSGAINASMATYDRSGAAFTQDQVAKGTSYAESLTDFKQAGQGLGKRAAMLAMSDSQDYVRGTTDAEIKLGHAADNAAGSLMDFAKMAGSVLLGGPAQAADMDHAKPLPDGKPGAPAKSGVPHRPAPAAPRPPPTRSSAAPFRPVEDPRLSPALSHEQSLGDAMGDFFTGLFHRTPHAPQPAVSTKPAAVLHSRNYGPKLTPEINTDIEAGAKFYRLDPEMMRRIAQRESHFNPNIKAPDTRDKKTGRLIHNTATGLFQFTEATWLQTLKAHGGELGYGKEAASIFKRGDTFDVAGGGAARRALLDRRRDPKMNAMLGAAYVSDNAAYLRARTGHEATGGELYAAHFLGPKGATDFVTDLQNDPRGDASRYFGDAAHHNPDVFLDHGRHRSLEEVMVSFERTAGGEAPPSPQPGEVHIYLHGVPRDARTIIKSPAGAPALKVMPVLPTG